jgi:RNA polymerase sigma-70 factor (ECF subfamily)
MTPPADVETAVADAHRRGWALVLAATARVVRDLDLAEECVQEAYAAALASWARDGIPNNPQAWLTTAAKRRAMDAVRREQTFRSKLPLLVEPEEAQDEVAIDEPAAVEPQHMVPDERLRLIFMCCHPALAQEAQLALTLRLVCGVTTADIARAFLVSEPTMAARMTRAKKKISAARIPFRLPGAAELPDRLRAVLGVIHLLFTAGHTVPSGASLVRGDLVDQSLRLARMLRELMPDEREVRGLLGLLLVTDARRATRVDPDGRLLPARLPVHRLPSYGRIPPGAHPDLGEVDSGCRAGIVLPTRHLRERLSRVRCGRGRRCHGAESLPREFRASSQAGPSQAAAVDGTARLCGACWPAGRIPIDGGPGSRMRPAAR